MVGQRWLDLCLHCCLIQLPAIFILDLSETTHVLYLFKTMTEKAERINGLAAMIGIIAAFGAYGVTGQIIPGIW